MSSDLAPPAVVCVLEVATLGAAGTVSRLRDDLDRLDVPLTVVGELRYRPALIIEADVDTAATLTEALMALPYAVEVVELRRHVVPRDSDSAQLMPLLLKGCDPRRLVVGAAAVERAMQRGRLEFMIVAANLAERYSQMLRAVVNSNDYRGPLVVCELTREQLGQAAGVHRAGCVGVLRGQRHVSL